MKQQSQPNATEMDTAVTRLDSRLTLSLRGSVAAIDVDTPSCPRWAARWQRSSARSSSRPLQRAVHSALQTTGSLCFAAIPASGEQLGELLLALLCSRGRLYLRLLPAAAWPAPLAPPACMSSICSPRWLH